MVRVERLVSIDDRVSVEPPVLPESLTEPVMGLWVLPEMVLVTNGGNLIVVTLLSHSPDSSDVSDMDRMATTDKTGKGADERLPVLIIEPTALPLLTSGS